MVEAYNLSPLVFGVIRAESVGTSAEVRHASLHRRASASEVRGMEGAGNGTAVGRTCPALGRKHVIQHEYTS